MKKILYTLFAGALLLAGCQKPQFIEPTVERQGITSLTAYFTSGKYTEMVMGSLTVTDPNADRFVIPIPWFYPEDSDDVTTLYMSKVRVRAELAENCSIDPPLTILDFSFGQEYNYTYTNAQGESRPIVITAQRVKSSTAKILSLTLVNDEGNAVLEGFIDNDNMEISLFSIEDLNGLRAQAQPWYHASVKDAEAIEESKLWNIEAKNWNEEQTVTIIAHDGKTEGTYKVVKKNPEKIDFGFNASSLKPLFNGNPYTLFNAPAYNVKVYPSLAYVGGYLVVSHGDGSAPVYVDGRNGSKVGEIATGGLTVGAVTSDEAGNMLLCNRLETAGTFEIYKTSSVTENPVLFYSYNSEISLPMGSKIKVIGDINKDARITVSYEGVSGVTSASQFVEFTVVGGAVTDAQVYDLAGSGISWGASPDGSAGLVPASNKAGVNGWYYAQYDTFNGFAWIRPDFSVGKTLGTVNSGNAWAVNPSWIESKQFNNANYIVLGVGAHFPAWGGTTSVYLLQANEPSNLSGYYDESTELLASATVENFNTTNADGTMSAGDVLIAPSADGFTVYLFYYDHYNGAIGAFSADCVKK